MPEPAILSALHQAQRLSTLFLRPASEQYKANTFTPMPFMCEKFNSLSHSRMLQPHN